MTTSSRLGSKPLYHKTDKSFRIQESTLRINSFNFRSLFLNQEPPNTILTDVKDLSGIYKNFLGIYGYGVAREGWPTHFYGK